MLNINNVRLATISTNYRVDFGHVSVHCMNVVLFVDRVSFSSPSEQAPCRYLIRNVRPRGLAEIDEADLNEEQQGDLAEIHETGLNEEQQGDLAEIHETGLNEEQQGDLAEIHETGLNEGHELGLAEVHDAVLDEGQEADQVAYEQHASVSSTIHSDDQPSNISSHEIQHDVRMRSDLASTRHLWPWGKLFGYVTCSALDLTLENENR